MTQNTQKPRDLSLDVAKAICIILMVAGHAGFPESVNHFVQLFRMPCFFFISGMLLSDRYLDTPGVGVRKKLTGLLRHGKVVAAVNYIGGKTLYILTFHFLCFKPVSLLWLWAHGEPLDRLSEFPILAGTDSLLWVAYTLAGVALPLVIWEAKERMGRKC